MNDVDLLRRYVEEGSQEAFAELVRLRLGLVYSAALRQTGGDAHRAQEVAQAVFTDLARKAAALCRHGALIGWLYTSTRYTAAKLARSERRRRVWEQEAQTMPEDSAALGAEIPGERLRPLLDDAMHQLGEADRRALLLRFFGGCSMAELGRSLGISESTAQKKVERALGKLKILLAKRGLSSTAAAVGAALGQEASAATIPTGLAVTVSSGALTAASAAAPGVGLLSLMTAAKLTAITGIAAIIGLLSIGTGAYELREFHHTETALQYAGRQYDVAQEQLRALERSAQAADKALGELRRRGVATEAANARAQASEKKERSDWQRFAAAFPTARNVVYELLKTQVDRSYRPPLERHGLTSAQIDGFVSRAADSKIQNIGLISSGVDTFGPTYGDRELETIIGEPAFQEWRKLRNPDASSKLVLDDLTTSAAEAGEPLSPDQLEQLQRNIAAHNPEYTGVGQTYVKVQASVQPLLSPSQWKAVEWPFLNSQYGMALDRAQKGQDANSVHSPGGN